MSDTQVKINNCTVEIAEGDITKIGANAIIAPINSEGLWFGGVDKAINAVAGDHFHSQARGKILNNLDAVFAQGKRGMHWNRGSFDNVVFVIDDLKSPLNEVVENGLFSAEYHGMKEILIPAMRTGVMLGVVESSIDEVADEIAAGIRKHFTEIPDSVVEKITIVVYNNREFRTAIRNKLADM